MWGSRINTYMTSDTHIMFEKYMASRKPVIEKAAAMDPVGQEDADINNDGVVDKQDEYLRKRRDAIAQKIHAKEESEEQNALNSHYNVNHEALDLVEHLMDHPKKYYKSDVVKILTIAADHLNHKA